MPVSFLQPPQTDSVHGWRIPALEPVLLCSSASPVDLHPVSSFRMHALMQARTGNRILSPVINRVRSTKGNLSGSRPPRTIPLAVAGIESLVPRRKSTSLGLETANNWRYDLSAVGASAGGLLARPELLRPLPFSCQGNVVVQHLDPTHK